MSELWLNASLPRKALLRPDVKLPEPDTSLTGRFRFLDDSSGKSPEHPNRPFAIEGNASRNELCRKENTMNKNIYTALAALSLTISAVAET
jgi:hypothetical protein